MSKKRTKKATSRKGARRPFKGHGPRRGIGRSRALSNKSKRARTAAAARQANANASSSALALATKHAAKQNFDKTLHAKDSGEPSKPKGKRTGKGKGSAAANAVNAAASAASSSSPSKKRRRKGKAASAATGASSPSKPGKKRTKKGGKKRAGKKLSKVMARRRYRQGRAIFPKMKLMHKWGLPRRGKVAPAKKAELRKAAGYADKITFKNVMDTIRAEKLKGWVCVGPKRTGCGGGSKNLRGGHQIGIYATGHR